MCLGLVFFWRCNSPSRSEFLFRSPLSRSICAPLSRLICCLSIPQTAASESHASVVTHTRSSRRSACRLHVQPCCAPFVRSLLRPAMEPCYDASICLEDYLFLMQRCTTFSCFPSSIHLWLNWGHGLRTMIHLEPPGIRLFLLPYLKVRMDNTWSMSMLCNSDRHN